MILDGKTVVVSGVGPARAEIGHAAGVRGPTSLSALAPRRTSRRPLPRSILGQGCVRGHRHHRSRPVRPTRRLRDGQLLEDRHQELRRARRRVRGLEEADWDSWRQAIEINLFGTMQMTQAVIPAMKERGGSVVFIEGQAMFWSQLPQAAYGASKAAILGAVTHLARAARPARIRVTPSCRRGCGGRRSRCTST